MKWILYTFFSVFLFSSCQKEYTQTDGIEPTQGTDSGTDTGGCNTYMPSNTGTTWTYNGSDGSSNVLTVVNGDTTIKGKVFKKLTSQTAPPNYFREEDGSIYLYADGPSGIGPILLNNFRANANINEYWYDTLTINGITERFKYVNLEKNIKYTVNGVEYSNVIHNQYKVYLSMPVMGDIEIQTTDAWYAKCIGPIEVKTESSVMGTNFYTLTNSLQSYTIK